MLILLVPPKGIREPDGQSLANLSENSSSWTLFGFPFKFLFHFPLLKITNFEGDS